MNRIHEVTKLSILSILSQSNLTEPFVIFTEGVIDAPAIAATRRRGKRRNVVANRYVERVHADVHL